MTKKQYLYGHLEIEDIPKSIITNRINALHDNLKELQTVDISQRDFRRIHKIVAAIDFWENINDK